MTELTKPTPQFLARALRTISTDAGSEFYLHEAADCLLALEAAIRNHVSWLERQGYHWTALAFRLLLDGKPNTFDFTGSRTWDPEEESK